MTPTNLRIYQTPDNKYQLVEVELSGLGNILSISAIGDPADTVDELRNVNSPSVGALNQAFASDPITDEDVARHSEAESMDTHAQDSLVGTNKPLEQAEALDADNNQNEQSLSGDEGEDVAPEPTESAGYEDGYTLPATDESE